MCSYGAQSEIVGILIQRIVFKINRHLIKCHCTHLITQRQDFNDLSRHNHQCAGEVYGSGVAGCGISVWPRILKHIVNIDFYRRNCLHRSYRHIQQQRCGQFKNKTELLINFASDGSCLPSNFSLIHSTIGVLTNKANADLLCETCVVSNIQKCICVKIVVKHNVANVVDAEIL